jgi:hypothetical protein
MHFQNIQCMIPIDIKGELQIIQTHDATLNDKSFYSVSATILPFGKV